MPRARKHLVCLNKTPYYHITSRCVRRAFLCGVDRVSGKSYEHRRSWIENRIRVLSSLFGVSLCAYAVMSNHYHLVVKVDAEATRDWSATEILRRWTALFKGPLLVQQALGGEALTAIEQQTIDATVSVYRERLGSFSWFMKCLNEPIARRANAEDGCTGHFWEARFHSQALCSERALISAMAYVDLNPIRAGMAKSLATSDYTSIQARLTASDNRDVHGEPVARLLERRELRSVELPIRPLVPFATDASTTPGAALPIRSADYLSLVNQTGRIVVFGKRGYMDTAFHPVLSRLGLSGQEWLHSATAFKKHFRNGDLKLKISA